MASSFVLTNPAAQTMSVERKGIGQNETNHCRFFAAEAKGRQITTAPRGKAELSRPEQASGV